MFFHIKTLFSARNRSISVCFLAVFFFFSAVSAQQTPPPNEVEEPWSWAQDAYRQGYYAEGIPFMLEAIQRAPETSIYYTGIARLYVQIQDYESAVFYYDLYLGEFSSTLTEPIEERYRPERIAEERQAVNTYRTDPLAPPIPPRNQEAVLSSLRERLENGPILTPSGGGAYADYITLLRAGYARPDLNRLRARLIDGLLDEAEAEMSPRAMLLPVLSIEMWEIRASRFENIVLLQDTVSGRRYLSQEERDLQPNLLTNTARPIEFVTAQLHFCDAQVHFLNLNYRAALNEFRVALLADPEFIPAHMGILNTLYHLDDPTTLAERQTSLRFLGQIAESEQQQQFLTIYQAVFEDNTSQAATLIGTLIGIN